MWIWNIDVPIFVWKSLMIDALVSKISNDDVAIELYGKLEKSSKSKFVFDYYMKMCIYGLPVHDLHEAHLQWKSMTIA